MLAQQFQAPKAPQGRYVVVVAEVTNLGKQMKTVTSLDLVDSQGRQFKAAPDRFQITPPQVFVLQNINPSMPFRYSTVFDIPSDATGLLVTVSDLAALVPRLAYVSLGQ
jgi:hypothetical protein